MSKTIQADMPGAVKLTRKHGDTLVCVRYRLSPDGRQRATTVELEIDRTDVIGRANPYVLVKIYASEKRLTALAKARGAWFNARSKLWRMRRNDAQTLGLISRIAVAEHQRQE
ncbi:MAG: hypothetical protein JNM33_11590 [Rubrivivax sp.]|nr:hypothetical protein [Rubrivivax sp.]